MKTAVAVRAHRTTRKLEALLASLSGCADYDLFLVANETRVEVDPFGTPKLTHTIDIMAPLGADYVNETRMVHCSDVVFSFLRRKLPDYDFVLVIEDDVHFPSGGRQFVGRVLGAIRSQRTDLVGALARRAEETWFWYPKSRHAFAEVYGIFFPFIGMSARAIDQLTQARQQETSSLTSEGPVFCEAFVPSVLMSAGGFVMSDVNGLVPGAYAESMFHPWLPLLLEDPGWETVSLAMVHPVYSAVEYLDKRFADAKIKNQVSEFIDDLEMRQAFLPAPLRAEYSARAAAVLSLAIMQRLRRLEDRLTQVDRTSS